MALLQADRDRLVEATVSVIGQMRGAYLGTPGASVLRHWDQIQDRLRAASRTSSTPEEWVTSLSRSLKLPAPDRWLSDSIFELTSLVAALSAARDWLDLVEREHAYLMSLVRLRAEIRAAKRKTNTEAP